MLERLLRRWRRKSPLEAPEPYVPPPMPELTYDEQVEIGKELLSRKATRCHRQVLDSYARWGLDVGPVSVFVLPPGQVAEFARKLERNGGLPRRSSHDAVGMYDPKEDIILIDGGHVLDSDEFEVRRVIGHEYGHRIFAKFMNGVQANVRSDYRKAPVAFLSTTSDAEYEGAYTAQRSLDSLRKDILERRTRPLTRCDRRRLEFETYVEERFVEALAAFMNNHITADAMLYMHSQSHKGEHLSENRRFFESMERGLHKLFYERMFTRGPRNVIIELPFVFQEVRRAYEQTYRGSIEAGIEP